MKRFLALLSAVTFLIGSVAAAPQVKERRLTDLDVIPTKVLKRSISPEFYQTLLVSPVKGWVVVRSQLVGTRLFGMRIIHSELNGAYDELALQRAHEIQLAGNYSLGQLSPASSVLLHLLIYKTADGVLALSFAHLDEPGGDQWNYWGCARLAVLQDSGRWVEIKGPLGLEGKGWAIRRGMENNIQATLMLEKIPGGR